MPIGHWHIQGCEDCGEGILTRATNGHYVLCRDCKNERKSEYQRHHKRYTSGRNGFHKEDMNVVIIRDPIPFCDGGFRSGASISLESFHIGLKYNNFKIGTEFEIRGVRQILRFVNGKKRLVHE